MKFLHKFIRWLMPPFSRAERLTVFERIMILWLFLMGALLFLYLGGFLKIGIPPFFYHGGLYCPGCGGTRALEYLIQGQLRAAWRYNPLFILMLPLLLYGGFNVFRSLVSGYPLSRINIPPVLLWLLLTVILLFTVLRNIPAPALDFLRPPA